MKIVKHVFTLIKICFKIQDVALKCCISKDKVISVTDFSRIKLCWRVGRLFVWRRTEHRSGN